MLLKGKFHITMSSFFSISPIVSSSVGDMLFVHKANTRVPIMSQPLILDAGYMSVNKAIKKIPLPYGV